MKKLLLSLAVVVAFAFYAFFASSRSPNPSPAASNPANGLDLGQSPSPATGVPVGTSLKTARYKDGTYTGPVADAYFGNIQVKAVVSGGKLSDVQFLQYPNDRGNSIRISQQSMPILKSEAIKAQSAGVDIISGATQTSEAFKQSLAAALAKAAN